MLINSYEFAIFFAAVFILHWLLPHRWRTAFLLVASYGFYAQWQPHFLLLIGLATAMDYAIALLLETGQLSPAQQRRVGLYCSGLAIAALFWPSGGEDLATTLAGSRLPLGEVWLDIRRWLAVGAWGLG
ncbi:MAG: hypothetical protein HC824_18395, partial [Synechococcales cyanobacterium RM1_1_8]|nr:hypothetical protein [Synechococcales cyanobacterium RM1_1_8]